MEECAIGKQANFKIITDRLKTVLFIRHSCFQFCVDNLLKNVWYNWLHRFFVIWNFSLFRVDGNDVHGIYRFVLIRTNKCHLGRFLSTILFSSFGCFLKFQFFVVFINIFFFYRTKFYIIFLVNIKFRSFQICLHLFQFLFMLYF